MFDALIIGEWAVDGNRGEIRECQSLAIHITYELDEQGNYKHRDAAGNIILPEEKETREELVKSFREIYESGMGDYLGDFIYALSGTEAVGGTVFASVTDALSYLAQHSDKLETDFADAYYSMIVQEITDSCRQMYGDKTANLDYGQFDETTYRLYWMTDASGKYVNQDSKGNFISPDQVDAFGNVIGKVYSQEFCDAITAQFKRQKPGLKPADVRKSPLVGKLADAASGYALAEVLMRNMESGLVSVATGKALEGQSTSIRAEKGSVNLQVADMIRASAEARSNS